MDTAALHNLRDAYLAALWHAAQANPAAFDDREACALVEQVGREDRLLTRRHVNRIRAPAILPTAVSAFAAQGREPVSDYFHDRLSVRCSAAQSRK